MSLPIRQIQPLKMAEQDRRNLFQTTQTQGYDLIMQLIEVECVLGDTELMGTDAADTNAVLANHRIAQARWDLFKRIKDRVASEVAELLKPEPTAEDEEQREIAAIVDANVEAQQGQ